MLCFEFIRSARSLASSHTPTPGSYLVASSRGSGRSGPSFILNQSSVDDEGLLANIDSTSPKKSKTVLRSVSFDNALISNKYTFYLQYTGKYFTKFTFYFFNLQVVATAFLVVWLNYFHSQGIPTFNSAQIDTRAAVVLTGRKILQVTVISRVY